MGTIPICSADDIWGQISGQAVSKALRRRSRRSLASDAGEAQRVHVGYDSKLSLVRRAEFRRIAHAVVLTVGEADFLNDFVLIVPDREYFDSEGGCGDDNRHQDQRTAHSNLQFTSLRKLVAIVVANPLSFNQRHARSGSIDRHRLQGRHVSAIRFTMN
jgi:hypothetical protein